MKHLRIFGLTTMVLAALAVVSSCGKNFQKDIDDLNQKYESLDGRVSKLEEQVAGFNDQLKTLSVLATAAESGFYITQVRNFTDGSYELTFNNGYVITLQTGPGKNLVAAPYISMTLINEVYYWTVNGMLILDASGLPIPATGPTPEVRYNSTTEQWTISVDGGMTFLELNVFSSIVINDDVLLQVINNYISSSTTSIITNEVLFQVITSYIQQNYSKIFNVSILKQVIVEYLNLNYSTIFNYDLLVQLFNRYNFEYTAQHIDVDILTNILINFISEHQEVFLNNEILFEIISNYVEVNKIDIFSNELVVEVINEFISKNSDFINVELMTQIINNYIDEHQDVIIDNDVLLSILVEYVQNNYTAIFSQDILYQVLNAYVVQNKTTIFNETLLQDILSVFVENNFSTIISNEVLNEIINNYVEVNKTTIINEEVLMEVISNFFKTNYNLIIDETFLVTVLNNYITTHQTTLIDIDIVRSVVQNYVQQNITTIFDVDVLSTVITNYFEENTTIIQQYFSEYTGVIKDVIVDGEICVVTLNNNETVELVVYDEFANIRDRVQSIVLIPNANGHITHGSSASSVNLEYIVTPSSMAKFIAKNYKDRIGLDVLVLQSGGNYGKYASKNVSLSGANGILTVTISKLKNDKSTSKALAIHVYDQVPGGTDYTSTFVPIDWN